MAIEDFINPTLFLKFGPIGIEFLLKSGLFTQFLAESFVEVDNDVGEAFFLLRRHFFVFHVFHLNSGELFFIRIEIRFKFGDFFDDIAFGVDDLLEAVVK